MSIHSDAAKNHIEMLLREHYPLSENGDLADMRQLRLIGTPASSYYCEYRFSPSRLWRFDYAVPAILCAKSRELTPSLSSVTPIYPPGTHYRA